MVAVKDWAVLLGRLGKMFGKTGTSPRSGNQEQINQEHAVAIGRLLETTHSLVTHARQGPDWQRSFRIPPVGTSADLTTPFHVRIVHDLGYITDRFVVVRRTNGVASGTQPTAMGNIRLVLADDRSSTYQVDANAVTAQAVFWVIPYREGFVPVVETGAEFLFGSSGGANPEGAPFSGSHTFVP